MINYNESNKPDREAFFDKLQRIKGAELTVIQLNDGLKCELMIFLMNRSTVVITDYKENRLWKIVDSATPQDFQHLSVKQFQNILADIANAVLNLQIARLFYSWQLGKKPESSSA